MHGDRLQSHWFGETRNKQGLLKGVVMALKNVIIVDLWVQLCPGILWNRIRSQTDRHWEIILI